MSSTRTDTPLRRRQVVVDLREQRAEKGVALEDVAAETRISVTALRDLEEGRFESLPNPVVAEGFALAYAKSVGLDPGAVRDTWRSRAPASTPPPDEEPEGRARAWLPVLIVLILLVIASLILAWSLAPSSRADGALTSAAASTSVAVRS